MSANVIAACLAVVGSALVCLGITRWHRQRVRDTGKTRVAAVARIVLAVLAFLTAPAVLVVSYFARYAGVRERVPAMAMRGDELIAAVRHFEQERGHAPERLDELVPTYVAAIPLLEFGVDSEWRFHRYGESWTLAATIAGPMVFDWTMLRYAPPDEEQSALWIGERYGDWVYVEAQ